MTWECRIKKVNNGFIVSYPEEQEEGMPEIKEEVFEDKDSSQWDEREVLADVFVWMADHFGFQYNKWKDNNLNIQWNKKGHKCE